MMKLTRDLALQKQEEEEYTIRKNPQSDVLLPEEVAAISGVLSLTRKRVKDLMLPIKKVYMVSTDQVLDGNTLTLIDKVGHSRIPVFAHTDRNFITGFLLVKRLVTCSPEG